MKIKLFIILISLFLFLGFYAKANYNAGEYCAYPSPPATDATCGTLIYQDCPANYTFQCTGQASDYCGQSVYCTHDTGCGCVLNVSCSANQGNSCNINACGQAGGTVQCDGTCSGATPALPSTYGNACTSSASVPNNCGVTNPGTNGTILCDGTCSASKPSAPADGTITCSSNADCGDANTCTTDVCINPGTCSSACVNTNNPVDSTLSSYGACSNTCGSGTQTRTCTGNSCGGDSTCGGASLSQACSDFSGCSYSWVTSGFGTCSVTCGGGTQTQTVSCQRSDGTAVADSYCAGPKPATSQTCNNQVCPACVSGATKTCGSGTCSGIQTCSGGTWGSCDYSSTDGLSCNDGSSCTTSDTCSSGTCSGTNNPTNSNWSSWSSCDTTCGVGNQTRTCNGAVSCGGTNNCTGSSSQSCSDYSGCSSPDFSISSTPITSTVSQGNSTAYTITINSSNSFSGTVNLTSSGCPSGTTCSYSSNSVVVPVNGSATTFLTVATSGATPASSYSLGTSGASGSLSHSASSQLVVTGGGGGCSAVPTLSVNPNSIVNGGSGAISSTNITNPIYSSSNAGVASVSGSTLTANSVGSVNISVTGTVGSGCSLPPVVPVNVTSSGGVSPVSPTGPVGGVPYDCNTSTSGCPVSGAVSCGTVRIIWIDNSNNETGFKIFKDGTLIYTAPASSPASATGGIMSYDYTPGDSSTHNYSVASTNGFGDSAQVNASNNPFAAIACVANLGNSDKDITAINGNAVSGATMCNSTTDPLPSSTYLKQTDVVSFRINLCNDNGTLPANSISLTDNLLNLSVPASGFNAFYNGSPLIYDGAQAGVCAPAGVNHYCAYGSAPNQILVFNLSSAGDNIAAGGRKTLSLDAKIDVPTGFSSPVSRFRNEFTVRYNGSLSYNFFTPYISFNLKNPFVIIREVP